MKPVKKLIGAIKAGQAFLGWDDGLYRQTLTRLTGKSSATHCNLEELQIVKEYMHSAGFPRQSARHGRRPNPATSRQAILSKIEALLCVEKRPWEYAESLARHMFKRQAIEWLTLDELTRLMQALIIDRHRRMKREASNG